jgi:hypothetical protein
VLEFGHLIACFLPFCKGFCVIFDALHKPFDDRIDRLLVEITCVRDPCVLGSDRHAFIFKLMQSKKKMSAFWTA